ncbi:hypothetical protein C8Q74DRAFT_494206 [Fomes fomentarius]|nr:hypothetical protein C8Q74DRAFT_494206 [Fomes fomentarius]
MLPSALFVNPRYIVFAIFVSVVPQYPTNSEVVLPSVVLIVDCIPSTHDAPESTITDNVGDPKWGQSIAVGSTQAPLHIARRVLV